MDVQSVSIRPPHSVERAVFVSALHSGADTDLTSAYSASISGEIPAEQADSAWTDPIHLKGALHTNRLKTSHKVQLFATGNTHDFLRQCYPSSHY